MPQGKAPFGKHVVMAGAVIKAAGTRLIGTLAGIAASLVLVVYLTPAELGVYYFVLGLSALVASIGAFGLGDALLAEIERRRVDGADSTTVSATAVLVSLGLGVLVGGATSMVLVILPVPMVPSAPWAFPALAGLVALQVPQQVLMHHHRARDNFVTATFLHQGQGRNLVFVIALCVIVLFVDIPSERRLQAVVVIFVLATGFPLIWGLASSGIGKILLRANRQDLKLLLRPAAGFFAPALMSLAMPHVMLVMVGLLAGAEHTASFGLAQRVAGAAALVPVSMQMTFLAASRAYQRGEVGTANAVFLRNGLWAFLATGLAALAYPVFGLPLINMLANVKDMPDVHETIEAMLLFAVVTHTLAFSTQFLRNLGAHDAIRKANMLAFSAAVVLALPLIGALGALGAALAMTVYSAVFHGMTTIRLRARCGLPVFAEGALAREIDRAPQDVVRLVGVTRTMVDSLLKPFRGSR